MSKHTKGNWHYRVDMGGVPEGIFVYGTGEVILSRLEPNVPLLETNARLMAAGPEMLIALKEVFKVMDLIKDKDFECFAKVRKAIEKAQGE